MCRAHRRVDTSRRSPISTPSMGQIVRAGELFSTLLLSTTGEATEYQAAIMAGSYCRMRYNFHQHKKYTTHHHLTFRTSSKACGTSEYQNLIISPSTLVLILIIRCGDVHVNPGPNNNTIHTTQPVISDDFQPFSKKGLHFIHLNIRSLLPKLDELILLATKTNAAVIGITESWLDDSVEDSEVEVCGYTILRHDRNRHGGGVCLYIRSAISFSPRTDLQTDNLETVWAEVLLPKTRPILTGICYRPPRQSDFFDVLELSINDGHCLLNVSFLVILILIYCCQLTMFWSMLCVILNMLLVSNN